jgi:hypothetical protein
MQLQLTESINGSSGYANQLNFKVLQPVVSENWAVKKKE